MFVVVAVLRSLPAQEEAQSVGELVLSVEDPAGQTVEPSSLGVVPSSLGLQVHGGGVGPVHQEELNLTDLAGTTGHTQGGGVLLGVEIVGVSTLGQQPQTGLQVGCPHTGVELLAEIRFCDLEVVLGRLEHVGEALVLSSYEVRLVGMDWVTRTRLLLPGLAAGRVEEAVLPDTVKISEL